MVGLDGNGVTGASSQCGSDFDECFDLKQIQQVQARAFMAAHPHSPQYGSTL